MTMDEPQAGTISTAQAARLPMVSQDWIRQLARKGYIPKDAKDRFNLVASEALRCEFTACEPKRFKATGRIISDRRDLQGQVEQYLDRTGTAAD